MTMMRWDKTNMVFLNNQEILDGVKLGLEWCLKGIKRHSVPRSPWGGKKNLTPEQKKILAYSSNIVGACGEIALSKFLDYPWKPKVDVFQTVIDVGQMECRTRTEEWHDLIIRPNDKDNRPYALVIGGFTAFRIVGWIWGKAAKQEKWWKNPDGGEYAFFVPQAELNTNFWEWRNPESKSRFLDPGLDDETSQGVPGVEGVPALVESESPGDIAAIGESDPDARIGETLLKGNGQMDLFQTEERPANQKSVKGDGLFYPDGDEGR